MSVSKPASFLVSLACALGTTCATASPLSDTINQDYDSYLGSLFKYFHANPELSLVEHKTAARMAKELTAAGFEAVSYTHLRAHETS